MLPLVIKKIGHAHDWLLRNLARETTSGTFIPEMDGLRFVAITLVVLFHLNGYLVAKWPQHHSGMLDQSGWLAQMASVGFRGVELFFVISGFILALPFATHRLAGGPVVNLRKYYLRRLTRLEPPYFVTVLVLLVIAVWAQGETITDLLPRLSASLLYLHNVIYGHASPIIGVAWSLEIEVQFYSLVPLLTLLFAVPRKGLRRSLLIAMIIAFSAAQNFFLRDARMALSILAYMQYFLAGFLVADLFVADWKPDRRSGFYWDAITLIGWPGLIALLQSDQLTRWLFPFLILLLYCAALQGTLTRGCFSAPWITAIGGMCYSIYLIHYEVISVVGRFTKNLGAGQPFWMYFLLQFFLVGGAVVAVCGCYFLLLEKPCMRRDWPQRLHNYVRSLFYAGRRAAEVSPAA